MAADALDVRMARLDGAYEQIRRLDDLHPSTNLLNQRLDRGDQRIDRLEHKTDTIVRGVVGLILVTWVTVILAILLRR